MYKKLVRMIAPVVAALFPLVLLQSANAAAPTLSLPANNATVQLQNATQKAYFAKTPRADRWAYMDSDTGRKAMIAATSRPEPVTFSWSGGTAPYTLTVKRVSDGATFALLNNLSTTSVKLYNFEIGRKYSWTVKEKGGAVSATRTFTTETDAPRFLRVGLANKDTFNASLTKSSGEGSAKANGSDFLPNFRDVGGVFTADRTQRMKQGLVFRSYEYDKYGSEWKPYGVDTDLVCGTGPGQLGIKTDIDLRSDAEVAAIVNTNNGKSPLNTTAHPVSWQHCAIAKYDAAQLGTAEKDALALVADASKYPLVFHCMCGQDRTGCLAIYIYSILGVDDETMLKSWEASSFFQGDNNWNDSDPGFRSYRIQGFIDSFRAYGTSSDTLAACVVKALKAKNVVTDTTIAQIRANLLETDEFCETPSSGGTLHATLSTDGVGYLETGYTPNLKTTKVELSFKQLTPSNGKNIGGYFVTGAGWTAKEQQLSLERYNSGNVGFLYNGCQTEWLTTAFTDTASSHTIWMCGNQAGLDSTTLTATNALVTANAGGTLKIGCGYYEYPSGSGIRAGVPMEITSCNIYENGSLVREYVPAKTSAGAVTLYDTKTKTFLTAVNAGGFTVGAKTGDIAGGDEPTPSDDPLPSAFDAAHTIVCWGDSLTFGRTAEASGETTNLGTLNNFFGGRLNGKSVAKSYPYYLAQQVDSSYNVIAQARSGMCADMILAWMGGTETKTVKPFTLPKTGTVSVATNFVFTGRPNGGFGTIAYSDSMRAQYGGLMTPVYALHSTKAELGATKIDNAIVGKLAGHRVSVTGTRADTLAIKSLDTLSAAVTIPAGTTFVPDATRAPYADATHVVFVGTNDGAGNYSDVIAQIENAVAKIPSGRYVVVSTHAAEKNAQTGETLTPPAASTLELAYAAAFGNHHLNLRLALYAKDATWETDGKLASDDLHFTPAGYQLVAEIVKEKLDALGYLGGTPDPGPDPVTYEKTVSVDETVTKLDITTSGTLTLNNAKLKVTGKVAKYDAVPLPNGLAADLTVKFIGANAALEYTGSESWLAPGYPTNGITAFTGSCTLDYTVPASGWRSAATAPLRATGSEDRVWFGKNVKFVIDATAVQPSAGETVKVYLASGTHSGGGVSFGGETFETIKARSTVTVASGMTYVFDAEKDAIVLSVTAPGTPTEKKGFERAKQENRPPRVLVIGNSFTQGVSRDLQYNGNTIKEYRTHFPTAVRAMGETIDYCALYRGGSSIQQHYEHRETKGFFAEIDWSFDSAAPSWARNGEKKGMFWCDEDGKTKDNRESETPPSDKTPYHICLDDLLNAVDWDVIMIQESAEIVPFWNAPESEWIGVNTPECRRDYETGTPRVSYGEPLANYVAYLKAKRPNAELWLHQTWALPAETPCIDLGTKAKRDWMYNAINSNAMKVAELYGTKTVPTGYAVQLYRYQYSDGHNPDVTDPCSYDLRHINGGYSIYAERKIPEEQRYRTYLQMMTWCQRWYGKMPAVGTTPCEPSVAAELTAMRAAALQAATATEYWDYGQGGEEPTPESPITLTAPANGSTLALYTANQKKYFALTGEAIKTQFTDFDESMMDSYLKIKVTFMWSGASGAVTLKIVRAADQAPFLTKSLSSGTKSLVVNNLEVGTAYTWSVEDAAGNRQTATFTTEAQAPRILYSQKVKSVRDLGGWTGLQGCRVKQGELIRTAEMDNFGAENRLSDDEIAFYRDVIGVKSDVDLRSDVTIRDEATQSVETTGRTPIPGATWYGCPVTGFGYQFPAPSEVAQLNTNFANFKKAFGYVLDATKRPLVFHCISGRDRTGTVAALTLALLGVSEDDIWREYRIAQDMTSADRFHIDEITGTLKSWYPAETLAASAKRYFTETLGFKFAEVEQFRAAMLPGYVPEEPPVSTLALTAPADGATVALYTADQKKYFALTGESIKTQYIGFDSSIRDRYLHPSVTLAWSGANGAVTVRVTRQGGRVLVSKELAAGTASLAVYNLEVGATYTWTVTDAEGASASAAFTTEAQAPRILNGDQIPSVRDLGGWVGLQGIRVKQGELVRTAHLDDESTGASLLTDTSRDTFLNVIGVKTELDFRSSTELAKIGRDSTSKLGATVTRYCYPIPSYALGDFVPGEDKPYGYFALAFQRVFDSGSRPLAFHCKIGRDRTGTFAAMILSLLGVSEDDIMREYRIAGDFSTANYFHIDEVIALLKTEFPADTLAASAKRYFTEAVGFTADEVEQFRAEMLPGYVSEDDPTPGEYVRTVVVNTTEKNLVFEGTAGRLVLDNATLTVSDVLETYVAYRFGENATGALSLEFAGANAGLVHSTAVSSGFIGSTTATSDMLVKFTVPATPWTVAPLRAEKYDSKIRFQQNVRFEVDATAVADPGPGVTNRVPLASGTAIDDDGVTPVGVVFDGVDFETVKARSTVTTAEGVTGELVYEGSALVLVLTQTVAKPTYYLVGADAAGASSFAKSSGTNVGWAETEGGTVLPSHTVSSDNDYVVPTGSILRTPAGTSPVTFAGGSLTLNFSILWKGSKTVTIPDLRIGAGTIQAGDRNLSATLSGQTTIPEGKTLHLKMFRADNSTGATWTLNTKIVGAGSIRVAGDSTTGATPTGNQTLVIADAADFTGNLYAQNQANPQKFILKVTGGFGGTVTSLPKGTEKVVFNYDGLDAAKGVVVADAATAVPEGLATGLVLYSATADFTAANLPLVTLPAGVTVDVADFTVSHATGADGEVTAFEGLGLVENADGTQTLVANAAAAAPEIRPGEGETEVEVTAASEDEAVAKVAIVSPDESIVTSGDYAGYFTKTAAPAAGESGRWVVSIELNKDVVKPDEVAAELAGKFGEIEEVGVMIMGAKPGLWYGVKEGNELGEELVEGPRVQAAADGLVALKVTKFPTSGFYRVVVGATGKAE